MTIHIVSRGETLSSIAASYSVSSEILAFNNDINPAATLPIGQPLVIVIPTRIHTVSQGETLEGIAERYGVSIYSLWRNNPILNGSSSIFPGQTIYISVERSPIGSFETGGYAYPFINKILLRRSLPLMSCFIPFTYGFRPDGTLVELYDRELLNINSVYQSVPVMHLSTLTDMGNFSTELAQNLFANPDAQTTLYNNVINNMRQKGYMALDIDFEFLGLENSEAYAEFVNSFRERLNAEGYGVIVALAPKTSSMQRGTLYEGHNYALLGQAANALLLMTYEWGYTYGPPLAVSPLPQVEEVVQYALTQIPAEKLFLGISNYGYDFSLPYTRGVSRAQSLSTARAFALASQFGSEIFYDSIAQAPHFSYTARGTSHEVWFEDARSISARLRLLPKYNLKGALYWSLYRQNTQNLVVLNDLINFKDFNLI